MTAITFTADTATDHTTIFSAVTAYIADVLAGAREGREIAARYDRLSRMSRTDLARLSLTHADVARAALTGYRC